MNKATATTFRRLYCPGSPLAESPRFIVIDRFRRLERSVRGYGLSEPRKPNTWSRPIIRPVNVMTRLIAASTPGM